MMNPFQLIGLLQGAQNPLQLMQNMMGNNPQFQRAMQMAQGKSPTELQQVCQNMCAQAGIDFGSAAAKMRQMGLNLPQTFSTPQNGK